MDDVIASVAPALQARIGAFRRKHRLPGVVAGVATADGLRWWHAAGFSDLEAGRRADQRTLHRVASITKTVTATAVLQLRDEGRLALDDPVVRHLPELAQVASPQGPIEHVTVRRLLMHTSGLQGEVPRRTTSASGRTPSTSCRVCCSSGPSAPRPRSTTSTATSGSSSWV